MTLVLDTSIVIELERGNQETIKEIKKVLKEYASPPSITFITYFEFLQGIIKRSPKNKEEAIVFLQRFAYINVTKKTAEILAELKIKYENKGITLPLADFLIIAQVREGNHLLITKDTHFKGIEEINKIIL